jgi:hypothetical protein
MQQGHASAQQHYLTPERKRSAKIQAKPNPKKVYPMSVLVRYGCWRVCEGDEIVFRIENVQGGKSSSQKNAATHAAEVVAARVHHAGFCQISQIRDVHNGPRQMKP